MVRSHYPILLLGLLLLFLICLPSCALGENTRLITLSGDPDDTFVAQQDCYAEGELVVLFFPKGMTIRGDMLLTVESVMDELSQATGLNYAPNYTPPYPYDASDMLDTYYQPGVFASVNPEAEKISVMVADLSGGFSPCAFLHAVVVDITDMDDPRRLALYHELAHVLYMRNGVDMGLTLDEGLATTLVDRIYRQKKIPDWTVSFYMESEEFDESCIAKGADGFSHCFSRSDDNYCYGYRFVTFLRETYGENVIIKLVNAATASHFDSSFGENQEADQLADTEHMKQIIFSVTGEDVFDRFAQWHETEMPRIIKEYYTHMESCPEM